MSDRIEKRVEINAPVSRVWRALTDHVEFGEWFRVKLDGPFVPGQVSQRPRHVPWLRTSEVGSGCSTDGTRTTLLVYLASLRGRPED